MPHIPMCWIRCGEGSVRCAFGVQPSHFCIRLKAFQALANFSATHRVVIAKKGGIDMALAAMRSHNQHASMLEHAVALLKGLAVDDDNEAAAVRLGAIDAVLNVMADFPSNAVLQDTVRRCEVAATRIFFIWLTSAFSVVLQCCRALINLGASAAHKLILAEKGGVKALLQAARMHSEVPEVQEQAFWALKNLTAETSLKKVAAAQGAIDIVISSMRRHNTSPGVQQQVSGAVLQMDCAGLLTFEFIKQGCGLLFNLAVDDDNVRRGFTRERPLPCNPSLCVPFCHYRKFSLYSTVAQMPWWRPCDSTTLCPRSLKLPARRCATFRRRRQTSWKWRGQAPLMRFCKRCETTPITSRFRSMGELSVGGIR